MRREVHLRRPRTAAHPPDPHRQDTLDEPTKLIGDTTIRAGNVTTQTKSGTTTTQKYESAQLKEVTTGTATSKYWYDALGNVDCVTLAAGTQANCSPSDDASASNLVADYAYDYLNRIASVRQFSSGTTRTDKADYTYDALDRTVKEVEDHAGTGKDRATTFTYQGLTSLSTEEKQTGGTNPKTKSFSYDAYGHRIGMVDVFNNTGETWNYTYSYDVHGSVSQLITATGKVKASYGYDAYGNRDAPSSDGEALTTGDNDNQTPLSPYRYTGKRLDSGTATAPGASATLDMGARRYGPDTTRFLQPDAYTGALSNLGLSLDPLTQNRYSLAGGNPISYVEVDGHMVTKDGAGGGTNTASPPKPKPDPEPESGLLDYAKRYYSTAINDVKETVSGGWELAKTGGACYHLKDPLACHQLYEQCGTAEGWKANWEAATEPIKRDCTSLERIPECHAHIAVAVLEAAVGTKGLSKLAKAGKGGKRNSTPQAPGNRAGAAYPVVTDPRTGSAIPHPGQGLQKVPVSQRVPWDSQERGAYIKEWYDRGYNTPPGGWKDYDIHHIRPRECGGTNDFDNLVPVPRNVHQQQFNPWWRNY